MSLEGKVVVITGASSGLGEALAYAMYAEKAKLVLAARSIDQLRSVAEKIPDSLIVQTDVSVEEQCVALVQKTVDHFGSLDILVNNAGISMSGTFEDLKDLSVFNKIMAVNLYGSVYCTHAAIPHLKKTKGLIVAVSSLTGKTGVPTRSAYAASKHAVQGFFDSIRIELRGTGVDVSVLVPGYIQSNIRTKALGTDGQVRNKSHLDESKIPTAEEGAAQMLAAIKSRRRETYIATKFGRIFELARYFAPYLVDTMSLRSIQSGQT